MSIATPTPAHTWPVLLGCLTVECADRLSPLQEAVRRLRDTGGSIFEVVVGAPLARYGPRVTLNAGRDPRPAAELLGYGGHPWGPPTWYGLRVGADGVVVVKPYHRARRVPRGCWLPVRLPASLAAGLVVEMAASDGDRCELYLRRRPGLPWSAFAETCAALVGAEAPRCAPYPRTVEGAHCVSLAWTGGDLTAVTLYAQDRCLPADRTTAGLWVEGLDAVDRRTYEAAVAGVRGTGRPDPRGWHAMLSWTVQADGTSHRAASLRVVDARVHDSGAPGAVSR